LSDKFDHEDPLKAMEHNLGNISAIQDFHGFNKTINFEDSMQEELLRDFHFLGGTTNALPNNFSDSFLLTEN
jgi:hypothetical protein